MSWPKSLLIFSFQANTAAPDYTDEFPSKQMSCRWFNGTSQTDHSLYLLVRTRREREGGEEYTPSRAGEDTGTPIGLVWASPARPPSSSSSLAADNTRLLWHRNEDASLWATCFCVTGWHVNYLPCTNNVLKQLPAAPEPLFLWWNIQSVFHSFPKCHITLHTHSQICLFGLITLTQTDSSFDRSKKLLTPRMV